MKLTAIIALTALFAISLTAQADPVTVTATATYYDDGTHSRLECMKLAA